jgi:hypothetical protein
MKITVSGEEYDLSRLTIVEAEAIEKVTGLKMSEVAEAGTASALRAMVWVAMKRKQPDLAFRDVDFVLEEVEVESEDPSPAPAEG